MKNCDKCNSEDLQLIHIGNNYDVYKCRKCGHHQLFKGDR